MPTVLLLRHGETAWSRIGRHTGRSDIPLDEEGERQARRLGGVLTGRPFALALASPLVRARRTAELAGLGGAALEDDLAEWDYGGYDGRSTAEIRAAEGAAWTIWTAPRIPPGPDSSGEQLAEVAARARRVLDRCEPVLAAGGDVALVSHGHLLRVLAACWLDLPPIDGRLLALSAGAMCELGYEHEQRVVTRWNVLPP